MSSLGVKLPIVQDHIDGFAVIRDFETLIKQNLKMLILTAPGERIMEPEFGVGMRNYLFENFNNQTYLNIERKIREQVEIYMPMINLLNIGFDGSDIERNTLGLQIFYSVPDIGITDLLQFTI